MIRIIVFLLFFVSSSGLSQNYNFIPKEFKEINDTDFFKIASSDTLKLVKVYLENGTEFTSKIKDSY